jgi:hypothetical protein
MRLLPILVFAAACVPAPAPVEPEPAAPAPAADVNHGTVPLPDATRAEICADDGLLLTRYDFHTIKHRFKELCCGADGLAGDPRCEQPWPFPERTSCARWDDLRYHIYARYGYVWEPDDPWHKRFAGQPWYREDPGFQLGNMSITAKRNDGTLRRFVTEKHECDPK